MRQHHHTHQGNRSQEGQRHAEAREERKVALSLRDHQLDSERRQVDEYHSSQGAIDQSLGRAAKQSRKKSQSED